MLKKVFALSADYGYINQITTLVKSILYHNHNSIIYVINKDIPQEWFANVNNRIRNIGSKIINLKIYDNALNDLHVSQPQINEMSYGRILIPKLIDEERVLYIDSDTVVDEDLSELFELDMEDHPIGAVEDILYTNSFNSGVVLFNIPLIKKDLTIIDKMLEAGLNEQLAEGDQSVMNQFFRESYLHLPLKYNYPIGYDFLVSYYPGFDHNYFDKTAIKGSIIHYAGVMKPWKQFSSGRYRSIWWKYNNLTWDEIINHSILPPVIDFKERAQFLIFTRSQDMIGLKELVEALPNCTFNIAAYTQMGEVLTSFVKYSNVHLYPSVVRIVSDQLLNDADAYLDINYGKEESMLEKVRKSNKPIVSFDSVNSGLKDSPNFHNFANDDLEGMINYLKRLKK